MSAFAAEAENCYFQRLTIAKYKQRGVLIIKKKKAFLLLAGIINLTFVITILFYTFQKASSYELVPLNTTNWTNITDENETAFVYVGRESCEQCSKFKPMLETMAKEHKITIYYFDTDVNKDIKDEIIQRYNIIAVPSIVVLTDDDFYIIMDSDNERIIAEILNACN